MTGPGAVRAAVVDAVRAGLPPEVTLTLRQRSGWRITARPARFETVIRSGDSWGWRLEAEFGAQTAALLRAVIGEVNQVLVDAGLGWRGLSPGTAEVHVEVDERYVRASLTDAHDHRLALPVISLPAVPAEQRWAIERHWPSCRGCGRRAGAGPGRARCCGHSFG